MFAAISTTETGHRGQHPLEKKHCPQQPLLRALFCPTHLFCCILLQTVPTTTIDARTISRDHQPMTALLILELRRYMHAPTSAATATAGVAMHAGRFAFQVICAYFSRAVQGRPRCKFTSSHLQWQRGAAAPACHTPLIITPQYRQEALAWFNRTSSSCLFLSLIHI